MIFSLVIPPSFGPPAARQTTYGSFEAMDRHGGTLFEMLVKNLLTSGWL
jgi:hypothetical protein